MYNVLSSFKHLDEFFYSLILLNSSIYTILLLFFFTVFFLFDFRTFRTLNEYKFFKTTTFLNTSLIVIFFSLAGIPPFLGFFSKLLLFSSIFFQNNFVFSFIFVVLNLFFIFFYIHNIRFIVSKKSLNIYLYKKYKTYFNFVLILLLVLFNYLNIVGTFLLEYILIWINQLVFFLKIY